MFYYAYSYKLVNEFTADYLAVIKRSISSRIFSFIVFSLSKVLWTARHSACSSTFFSALIFRSCAYYLRPTSSCLCSFSMSFMRHLFRPHSFSFNSSRFFSNFGIRSTNLLPSSLYYLFITVYLSISRSNYPF